jgi:protein O-GlcNAc transferase
MPNDPPAERLLPLFDLYNRSRLEQAFSQASQLLIEYPNSGVLYNFLGGVNAGNRNFDAAINNYTQALKIKPDYAEAYFNMGNAMKVKGDLAAAIDNYKKAIKNKTDYAGAYNNMGVTLNMLGDSEAAIICYEKSLHIDSNHAEAYYNKGNALKGQEDFKESIASYKRAIELNPEHSLARNNMGVAYNSIGESELAIQSYNGAIRNRPNYAEAYYNLGNTLTHQGDLSSAIENYRKALEIRSTYLAAQIALFSAQQYMCFWADSERTSQYIQALGTTTAGVAPFMALSLEDSPERHRRRSELYTKQNIRAATSPAPQRPSVPPSRLRIGYFSADFKKHPVSYLMVKVFEAHNRDAFEIYGYSIGDSIKDSMRDRLVGAFDVFRDVQDLSGAEIAVLAQRDKIDLAIDLSGHTKQGRPTIFANRAAPIQINYLGYPGTMGADFIDYIIADQNLIPKSSRRFYSEKPIYLPHHYQAQDDQLPIARETPSRESLGLPGAAFVYCAISNSHKISPSEFDVWMRLLLRVNGSVLWLLETNTWMRSNLCREALARGVDPVRLVFTQMCGHEKYLAQFRQADLYLDTFTYNAGATASNALWAGLPVLTKLGEGYTARMAGSLLSSIGLPELITTTEIQYEELAYELATDPVLLPAIKRKLALNRTSSPLFRTGLFTQHLESGYAQAYQRYFEGKDPETIFVQP